MSRIEGVVYCDNCGVEITWAPYIPDNIRGELGPDTGPLRRFDYCCRDCYEGRLCHCGERMEWDDERRSGADSLPMM